MKLQQNSIFFYKVDFYKKVCYNVYWLMIPKGLLRLVKICLAGSLLLTCSFIRTSVAEAPYLISSKLNNEELITRQDYCDRIELLCEQYDFAYFSFIFEPIKSENIEKTIKKLTKIKESKNETI